ECIRRCRPDPVGLGRLPCSGGNLFFQAEDGIRDKLVTGVQTCALPISLGEVTRPVEVDLGAVVLLREVEASADVAHCGRDPGGEIGRASWRERGEVWVGCGAREERMDVVDSGQLAGGVGADLARAAVAW